MWRTSWFTLRNYHLLVLCNNLEDFDLKGKNYFISGGLSAWRVIMFNSHNISRDVISSPFTDMKLILRAIICPNSLIQKQGEFNRIQVFLTDISQCWLPLSDRNLFQWSNFQMPYQMKWCSLEKGILGESFPFYNCLNYFRDMVW